MNNKIEVIINDDGLSIMKIVIVNIVIHALHMFDEYAPGMSPEKTNWSTTGTQFDLTT